MFDRQEGGESRSGGSQKPRFLASALECRPGRPAERYAIKGVPAPPDPLALLNPDWVSIKVGEGTSARRAGQFHPIGVQGIIPWRGAQRARSPLAAARYPPLLARHSLVSQGIHVFFNIMPCEMNYE